MINFKKISYGTLLMSAGGVGLLLLLISRIAVVISFSEPLHIVTSGCEEESLFAVWKWVHDLAIYSDPHQIPFAASYFNWLFYVIYGSITAFLLKALHLSDEWIPTIGRCITLITIAIGCGINIKLFKKLPILLSLSLSFLLWFGPLLGYWSMTVRPDVIGLLFDLIAVYFFLQYASTRPILAVLLAALGCYLSWSCKQVNIITPIAIGLTLLWDRKWMLVSIFSITLSSAYALTIFLANPMMLKALFFVSTAVPLSLEVLQTNFVIFIKKTIPIWFLLVAMIFTKSVSNNQMSRLGWCGLLAWSLVLLPASSKVGSADNYHFIALLFLLLIIAPSLENVLKNKQTLSQPILAFSGILTLLITTVAFTNGSIQNLQKQHENNLFLQAKYKRLQAPIFNINAYLSLPWMHSGSESFILSYNYWFDRASGEHYEQNGIGGLIKQGYFNTLILPISTSNDFDSAALLKYKRLVDNNKEYAIYTKKEFT